MIKVTIQTEARRRGIKNAHQFQKKMEFAPAVAADLWKGEKIPRLETLDRICAEFGCEIADLVRYVRTRRPASRNGKG